MVLTAKQGCDPTGQRVENNKAAAGAEKGSCARSSQSGSHREAML